MVRNGFWSFRPTHEVRAVVQLNGGQWHGFATDREARARLTMWPGCGPGFWRVKRPA